MDGRPQERILKAVLGLLDDGGAEAVSTRAVGEAANVQAPAIYRLFGDKQGLLEAAVERGYADWVRTKADRRLPDDPVEALRVGWDDAVDFGISHPAMYRISITSGRRSGALTAGRVLLREKLRRVAAAGRLRVSEEQALALMQATARGVVLSIIDSPPDEVPDGLAAQAREAVIAAITTDGASARASGLRTTAAALRAQLQDDGELIPAERALLDVWLARISSGPASLSAEPGSGRYPGRRTEPIRRPRPQPGLDPS